MQFDRLLELLQAMPNTEQKRLRLYVSSPFFVQGKKANELLPLLDHALYSIHKTAEKWPDNTAVAQMLYSGKGLVKGKIDKRIAELYQLVLKFVALEMLLEPENELGHQLALAKSFQKRRMFGHSNAALVSARKLLDKVGKDGSEYYLSRLMLTSCEVDQMILSSSRDGRFSFEEGFESLYRFYQATKLELIVAIASLKRQVVFSPTPLSQHILNEKPYPGILGEENPLLYLFSQFLLLTAMDKPAFEQFEQFVHYLRQHEATLQPDGVKRFWAMARNILTNWWIKDRSEETGRRYLELTRENLAKGHLYYNGAMLPHTLESFCNMALNTGQPDLAYRVLMEHRGRITGEPADEPFFHFNLARYHLHTRNPNEALRIFPVSMPENGSLVFAKALEIQILYELDSPLLPYRMDAFRLYLNRSAPRWVQPDTLQTFRLFLNLLGRIRRCPSGDAQRAEAILSQIRATPNTSEYVWLLKKAAEKCQPSV